MYLNTLDFGQGEEVDGLRDMVRRFAEEKIAPLSAEIDRSNEFPSHLWKELGALGLLGITADPDFGGSGMGAGNPGLTVGADVVGAFGNVKGHLFGGASGENPVKIVAINPVNNRVLKTNTYYTSDWSMQDLPQGPVVLKVVGRWQFEDGGTEKIASAR